MTHQDSKPLTGIPALAQDLTTPEAIRRAADWGQKGGDDSNVDVKEPPVVAPPKAVTEIRVSAVFNRVSSGVYMETQEDVSSFIEALAEELEAAIKQEKRVRIR